MSCQSNSSILEIAVRDVQKAEKGSCFGGSKWQWQVRQMAEEIWHAWRTTFQTDSEF